MQCGNANEDEQHTKSRRIVSEEMKLQRDKPGAAALQLVKQQVKGQRELKGKAEEAVCARVLNNSR